MTKTERAIKATVQRLQKEQSAVDDKTYLRSLTVTAIFDKQGRVYATDFSYVEREILLS